MKISKYIFGLLVVILFASGLCTAQSLYDGSKLGLFIRSEFGTVNSAELQLFFKEYNSMIARMKEKKEVIKSDEAFLKQLFYKVHRKFLGDYEQGVSFNEMIGKRKAYDCVTGTALYTLILDELDIDFEIRETDYHVYLLVHSGQKTFMFESTDPLYGFAYSAKEIDERRAFVINDTKSINEQITMTGLSSQDITGQQVKVIDNAVSLHELAGLQYYNQALRAFNDNDYRAAYKHIIVAQGAYPSKRIKYAASYMFSVAYED